MTCWAEMVLLFVVACVPSLPKVFMSLGLAKMFSSLTSWALPYGSDSRLSNRMRSRTRPVNVEAPGRNVYHQIDEYSLGNLTPKGTGVNSVFPEAHHPQRGRIIRTTHITATEEYTLNTDTSLSYQDHHPWTAQGRSREERRIV